MPDLPSLSSLQSSLGRWDSLEYFSAALVLFGVAGESLLELTDIWKNCKHRKRLVIASALLLIVGLAFELACAVMISSTVGQITAILNKETGDARQEAGTANDSAAKAQNETASLEISAAKARTAQQKVEIELAEQQEKTAKAEKELAELKEAMRPRALTREQQAALIRLLSDGPKGPVNVVCVLGDDESKGFATQIDNVLASAGWNVGQFIVRFFPGSGPVGFGIVLHSTLAVPSYVLHIQQAFFAVGVPVSGVADSNLPEGTVEVTVGHKPNPVNQRP
jgi:hypothetical protein